MRFVGLNLMVLMWSYGGDFNMNECEIAGWAESLGLVNSLVEETQFRPTYLRN